MRQAVLCADGTLVVRKFDYGISHREHRFRTKYGPRGAIKSFADDRVEDAGHLQHVEGILALQQRLIEQAAERQVPVLSNVHPESTHLQLLPVIADAVLARFSGVGGCVSFVNQM